MGRLDGKIAVITGACSGIGLGTVELFIEEGAHVLAADIQDAAGAELEARFPGKVRYQRCDVMVEAEIAAAMQAAVDSFGGLDILFNNAGAGGSPQTIEEMTGEAWDFSFNLLLRSVALGMRYVTPFMQARGGGAIINTASVAGLEAGRGPIAYSVAKAGVIHLSKVGAAQLSRHNIRVNAICPGLILTNIFTPAHLVPEGLRDQIKAEMRQTAPNTQPIKKPGEPRDIAEACLFFASDAGAFVTGTHILVDGGLLVGPRQAWDPMMQAERQREIEARRAGFAAARES